MLCFPGRGRGPSIVPTYITLHQRNAHALLTPHPFTSPDRLPSLHPSLPSIQHTAQRKLLPFLSPHPSPTRYSCPHCAGRTAAGLPQFGGQRSKCLHRGVVRTAQTTVPRTEHTQPSVAEHFRSFLCRVMTPHHVSCVEVPEARWLQRSPVGWGLSHTRCLHLWSKQNSLDYNQPHVIVGKSNKLLHLTSEEVLASPLR